MDGILVDFPYLKRRFTEGKRPQKNISMLEGGGFEALGHIISLRAGMPHAQSCLAQHMLL